MFNKCLVAFSLLGEGNVVFMYCTPAARVFIPNLAELRACH